MERFILQESKEPGKHVVTDTEHGIVIKFTDHQFNETQQVTFLDTFSKGTSVSDLARYAREIGDWLAQNHYDLVF